MTMKKICQVVGEGLFIVSAVFFIAYFLLFPIVGMMLCMQFALEELEKRGWTGPEQLIPLLLVIATQCGASYGVCYLLFK
jgi:hypothetical protein